MDYYSLFWGPGVISMINERPSALTSWLSTLAVFVDSDPFRGPLLTISWTIIVLADSGPFLGLLLSFGGPGLISTIYEPRGAFLCRS